MAEAEVTVDASNGVITVRGDQGFVTEILEKYKFVFDRAPKAQPKQDSQAAAQASNTSATSHSSGQLSKYDNVFDVDGDNVSILVSPPGNSLAAQQRALTLLFLYARLQLGQQNVPAEDVKEQCKAHACYDSKNFFGNLKIQKNLVTITGSGSSAVARLTVPGRKAAEELAQTLQNGS